MNYSVKWFIWNVNMMFPRCAEFKSKKLAETFAIGLKNKAELDMQDVDIEIIDLSTVFC